MNAILRTALFGVLFLAPASIACAQFFPVATLTSDYYPDRVATPYDFKVEFASRIDFDAVTIQAPDGTLFEMLPDHGVISQRIANLTAVDLNRFIGVWTINDSQGLPNGAPPQQHTFAVSRGEITRSQPLAQILSPAEGAVLPPIFEARTSGSGLHLQGPGDPRKVKFLSWSPGVRTYQYLFAPGETEVEIEARASNQVIDISGASAPEQANRRFSLWTINNTYSPPTVFTVRVPEPATLATGCFALLSLAALRRRKL